MKKAPLALSLLCAPGGLLLLVAWSGWAPRDFAQVLARAAGAGERLASSRARGERSREACAVLAPDLNDADTMPKGSGNGSRGFAKSGHMHPLAPEISPLTLPFG